MADSPLIETNSLVKRFPGTVALRSLDLSVAPGSIHAFMGRNGAGKSTTIRILLGMTRPDAGSARVFGMDAANEADSLAIRSRIGFVSDERDLYDDFTVDEMIRFTRSFYPRWRGESQRLLLDRFGLSRHATVKTLSRGTRTKLALLLSLCRGADLLILDEPTAGLDPSAAEDVLQVLVAHVASEGATVFFSSHQVAEVEQVADHLTIVSGGRAVVAGALDDVRERWRRIQVVFGGEPPLALLRAPGVRHGCCEGRIASLITCGDGAEILREARALNALTIDVLPLSLKDIFLHSEGESE